MTVTVRVIKCGTHALWVTESNELSHMVSSSVFFFFLFSAGYFYTGKIQNMNMVQIKTHELYPHLTP